MANNKKINPYSGLQKLKLLFTIVNQSKANFYVDQLEQFEVNASFVSFGSGTCPNSKLNLLGLGESEKAVIISVIKEDDVKPIMKMLNEKFELVKNGKGIAYVLPISSIIGVSIYQFLANNDTFLKEI